MDCGQEQINNNIERIFWMRLFYMRGRYTRTYSHTQASRDIFQLLTANLSLPFPRSVPWFSGLYPGMRRAVASSADTPFAEKVGRKAWLIMSVD